MSLTPSAPSVSTKRFGITELPEGEKKLQGNPEMDHDKTYKFIEINGVRLAWSRACFCPCDDSNSQTQQPDPNCVKCGGRGFFYFGPKDYVASSVPDVGELDDVQKAILSDDGAAVIRGLMTRSTNEQNPYDLLGNWVRGSMFLTVRPENRIGYYDRLVNLDARISYSETVDAKAVGVPLNLRYRAVCVNNIETVTDRFQQDTDFTLDGEGRVVWTGTSPAEGTRLAVHYDTHPTWLVVEHPHVIREAPARRNIKEKKTPLGTPRELPIQAMVQLEFIAKHPTSNAGEAAP